MPNQSTKQLDVKNVNNEGSSGQDVSKNNSQRSMGFLDPEYFERDWADTTVTMAKSRSNQLTPLISNSNSNKEIGGQKMSLQTAPKKKILSNPIIPNDKTDKRSLSSKSKPQS